MKTDEKIETLTVLLNFNFVDFADVAHSDDSCDSEKFRQHEKTSNYYPLTKYSDEEYVLAVSWSDASVKADKL